MGSDLSEVTQQSGTELKGYSTSSFGYPGDGRVWGGVWWGSGMAKGTPSTFLLHVLGFPPLAMPPHVS